LAIRDEFTRNKFVVGDGLAEIASPDGEEGVYVD
jgi:hypothetical protein